MPGALSLTSRDRRQSSAPETEGPAGPRLCKHLSLFDSRSTETGGSPEAPQSGRPPAPVKTPRRRSHPAACIASVDVPNEAEGVTSSGIDPSALRPGRHVGKRKSAAQLHPVTHALAKSFPGPPRPRHQLGCVTHTHTPRPLSRRVPTAHRCSLISLHVSLRLEEFPQMPGLCFLI